MPLTGNYIDVLIGNISLLHQSGFNPIQDGSFWGCSRMGVGGGGEGRVNLAHLYRT